MGNVGEVILDKELSTYILRGLPDAWESFVQSVSGRDNLPKYDKLWADCVEEEDKILAKSGDNHEENQALAARWKGKKKRSFPQMIQGERSDNKNEGRSNNRYDRRSDNRYERRSDKRKKDRSVGQSESCMLCLNLVLSLMSTES